MFLPRIGVVAFSEEMALYSHLRFVTAASLIAFGGIIAVGVPALLFSAVERPLVARAEISDSTASACKHHSWLHFDRNCVARHDLLSTAGRGASNGGTVAARSEPDKAAEQPLTENRHTATVPQDPIIQDSVTQDSATHESVPQGSVAQEFIAKEPAPRRSKPPEFVLRGLPPQQLAEQEWVAEESAARESAPQEPAKRSDVTTPRRAKPAARRAAEERHAAKPANGTRASLPAGKKAIRSSRIAKRSTNEALNVVRRFGDSPRELPASAFAGNATRAGNRTGQPLDIRPTSMQDVYYYSTPR
jgi:hypothetical protein